MCKEQELERSCVLQRIEARPVGLELYMTANTTGIAQNYISELTVIHERYLFNPRSLSFVESTTRIRKKCHKFRVRGRTYFSSRVISVDPLPPRQTVVLFVWEACEHQTSDHGSSHRRSYYYQIIVMKKIHQRVKEDHIEVCFCDDDDSQSRLPSVVIEVYALMKGHPADLNNRIGPHFPPPREAPLIQQPARSVRAPRRYTFTAGCSGSENLIMNFVISPRLIIRSVIAITVVIFAKIRCGSSELGTCIMKSDDDSAAFPSNQEIRSSNPNQGLTNQ
ncbi:hypothetical protein EVAR_47196_1 [Eumeta japonica]|uniref:Uncharacterized protein n=1 Tax=Eumeta variegata TaxID=151549 RepID=A0A4C1WUX3_EUMVA|nr:hypothetical protein EVAR_47196_1 [Eumeta japonica]